MLVSVTSHSSSKETRLFSRNVKVIVKEENKPYALRSLVPNGKVVINAGATVRVNFTVINVGQAGEYNFKVSRLFDFSVLLLRSVFHSLNVSLNGFPFISITGKMPKIIKRFESKK